MAKFKFKSKSKFVDIPLANLRLTRKEYSKACERFAEREKMKDRKFKRLRSVMR